MFNSVPTIDTDLERLHTVMHDNFELDNRVNFDIIQRYIKKLKPHKHDGNYGFKSDHLINGLNVVVVYPLPRPLLVGGGWFRCSRL